jgi:hypothetical protein
MVRRSFLFAVARGPPVGPAVWLCARFVRLVVFPLPGFPGFALTR